jgi:transcriptional regulator with XRE-family HTH domain
MPGKSASAIDQFVSEKVRARRKELGMTQQTLAANVGVTFQRSAWQNWMPLSVSTVWIW